LAFTGPRPPDPDSDLARATATVRQHLRQPSPAQYGMGSLADPERIREVLSAAGFVEVTTTPVDAVVLLGRAAADAAQFLVATGPYRHNLERLDLHPVASPRASAALAETP